MLRLRQLGSLATRVDVLKQGSPVGSLLFRHDFATEREGRGKGEDDADFELLPPGCSMVDPTYALNESDKNVHFYDDDLNDEKHTTASHHHRTGRVAPPTPSNLSAAEKELEAAKSAKQDDIEPYVYLPPGCSMKDPAYHSMSDPHERPVYYRDPSPTIKRH